MKKGFTIALAFLMLLSVMHITVATHFCDGKLAQALVTVTGHKATCGMETTQHACPLHSQFASGCCKDYLSTLIVDGAYDASVNYYKNITQILLLDLQVPVSVAFNSVFPSVKDKFYSIPPGGLAVSVVSRPSSGVFQL